MQSYIVLKGSKHVVASSIAKYSITPILVTLTIVVSLQNKLQAKTVCDDQEKVCTWEKRIVGIKTPTMTASGFLLDDGTLITNKHVAEDHPVVKVKLPSGQITTAKPSPNDHPADLAILVIPSYAPTFPQQIKIHQGKIQKLRVIAFDQGRNGTRIYPASTYAIYPDSKKFPQARIHSDVFALPGNSGGAVVTELGELVGILASGDGNINEIVPAQHIAAVQNSSDDLKREDFVAQGTAIRMCADLLHESNKIAKNPPASVVSDLETACLQSKNKQLFDQAGQLFGKWWMFSLSEMFLTESLKLDPNSPNTLMSLAVAYHLNRDYIKEKPLLEKYLELNPSDPQALRLSVQVAGLLKDEALAEKSLELMREHNPNAVEFAQEFLDSSFGN